MGKFNHKVFERGITRNYLHGYNRGAQIGTCQHSPIYWLRRNSSAIWLSDGARVRCYTGRRLSQGG